MLFERICPPALLYLVFSITQIAIDSMKGLYNTALIKTWVAIVFTIILNYLCESGLGIVSWIIVFIPFILMTLIVAILLLMFGLDPSTGKMKLDDDHKKPQHHHHGKKAHHHRRRRKDDWPNDEDPLVPRKRNDLLDHSHEKSDKYNDNYYKFLDPRKKEILDRINRYTDKRIVIPGVNESAVDHKNRKKTVELGSEYEYYSENVSSKRRTINGIYNILSNMNEDNEGAFFLNQSDVCLQETNDTKCNSCIKKLILRTVSKMGPNKGSFFYNRVKEKYPDYV
uniref:Uncharacterized protein n=1 Tax=viral metagenome TaxID=1070528 RepID=A0A6C0C1C1_9ZZZZ